MWEKVALYIVWTVTLVPKCEDHNFFCCCCWLKTNTTLFPVSQGGFHNIEQVCSEVRPKAKDFLGTFITAFSLAETLLVLEEFGCQNYSSNLQDYLTMLQYVSHWMFSDISKDAQWSRSSNELSGCNLGSNWYICKCLSSIFQQFQFAFVWTRLNFESHLNWTELIQWTTAHISKLE